MISVFQTGVLRLRWIRQYRLRMRLKSSGLFVASWYLENNPDVAAANFEPLKHYMRHGLEENRSPGPSFNAPWYAAHYKDAIGVGTNALTHFLLIGQANGYRTSSDEPIKPDEKRDRILRRIALLRESNLFDPAWYESQNPDVVRTKSNPFLHFAAFGSAELRSPGPDFNAQWYYDEYLFEEQSSLDTSMSRSDPLFHFIEKGKALGFATKPVSVHSGWMERYHTIDAEEVALLRSGPRDLSADWRLAIFYYAGPDTDETLRFLHAVGLQEDASYDVRVVVDPRLGNDGSPEIMGAGITLLAPADVPKHIREAERGTVFLFVPSGVSFNRHAFSILRYYTDFPNPFLAYADHEIVDPTTNDRTAYVLPDHSPRLFSQISAEIGFFAINRAALDVILPYCETLFPESVFRGANSISAITFVHIEHFLASRYANELLTAAPASLPLPDSWPSVAIIIPTRDQFQLLHECVESILTQTDYDMTRVDLILVDNKTTEPQACDFLADLAARGVARVLVYEDTFNYSSVNNWATTETNRDILVFLNNDTKVIRSDWLKLLASEAVQPQVGAVGAKLIFPDETVQHGGVIVGLQGVAGHAHTFLAKDTPGFQGLNLLTHEVSAVTGACLAIRRAVFTEVGGFDANLQIAFNDVSLCLEIKKRGYRNIWVNEALLVHYESKTRGYDVSPQKREKFILETLIFNRLQGSGAQHDPLYNSNLSLETAFEFAEPPRQTRPWRFLSRIMPRKRIMMLSSTFQRGHGVAVVISLQARRLLELGYEVWLVGPANKAEIEIAGARRLNVASARSAARYAQRFRADVVIAHSPPFFSVVRFLADYPTVILYDYGEPPEHFFPDADDRREVKAEKSLAFAKARFKAAISKAVANENPEDNVVVLPLANSHLTVWEPKFMIRREQIRHAFGWGDAFVILNVCRFQIGERYYKGVGDYIDVTTRAKMMNEDCHVVIVHCGKGDPEDIEALEARGIHVFANVSDEVVTELYLAADIFISMSKWEGYNLGIAQALALGVPVLASRIPAHDAFLVETFQFQSALLNRLNKAIRKGPLERIAKIYDWTVSLDCFVEFVEKCLDETLVAITSNGPIEPRACQPSTIEALRGRSHT